MSNGEGMARAVQGMTSDEKLVFLITEVGNIKSVVTNNAQSVNKLSGNINDLNLLVAQLPKHCAHEADFIKMCKIRDGLDGRLEVLEQESAGRKAVAKALWGAGSVGFIGIIFSVLNIIFKWVR